MQFSPNSLTRKHLVAAVWMSLYLLLLLLLFLTSGPQTARVPPIRATSARLRAPTSHTFLDLFFGLSRVMELSAASD